MKRGYFKIYIYISLIFLVIALYFADYLIIPSIVSFGNLAICVLLLFFGFLFDGIAWTKILNKKGLNASLKHGIASAGLSIFGKYIPGKLWVVLGRSEYIAERYKFSRKELNIVSLDAQFISIWIGLILGSLGLLLSDGLEVYGIAILIMFTGLTLVIFTNAFHGIFKRMIKAFLKKTIEIPRLGFKNIIRVLPWFLMNWLFWSISFYFLIISVSTNEINMVSGLGFALAGSVGILAVIAPGGIGVREGILTFYLTQTGIGIEEATTISVVSRLWFLTGEVGVQRDKTLTH